MSISSGTRFAHYEVAESIGAGGMGEVWRATDTRLKRDVAIKILPQAFVDDADRLARFRREAEILASLNHPNIAHVYGLEDVEGQTAIVMELVEGPTLADRITQGPIPPDEAMSIALQVIGALEAAHDKHIVHRDLKPANVKLREDGTVKVLDFGISKPIDASAISGTPVQATPAVTQTGIILGTAAYMSPEQAQGKFVDERTDVWAFGCLLFEMLTGQPAFAGENVMAILARVIDRDTDLSSIPGTISPAVRHTLKLCLEKDPRKRIRHIGDVRLALEGTFETGPPRAISESAVPAARSSISAVAAALVVGVIITAAIGVSLWPEPEPRPVRRSAYVLPEGQSWTLIAAGSIAVSPDGSEIAYSANGALYRRRLNELEGRVIPGTEGEVAIGPVYSPDGEWLLYRAIAGQQLKRVAVEGGTPLTVVPDAIQIFAPSWTVQETIYYCVGSQVFVVAPTGGEPELIAETEPGPVCFWPTVLPGTDLLVYEKNPNDATAEIVVQSTATGEITALFPGRQPVYREPYLIYFDPSLGLMARHFDPQSLKIGSAVGFGNDVFVGNDVAARVSVNGTLLYTQDNGIEVNSGNALSLVDPTGNIRQLGAPFDDYRVPAASPAGDQIAVEVVSDDVVQIYVYDVTGDTEIRQLTFEGSNIDPVWTKDGGWVVFASDRDGAQRLWRKRANGRGAAEPVTDPAEGLTHSQPAFTSDGARLAFVEQGGPDGADIRIMDYPDGEPELLVGGGGAQFGIAFSPDGLAMAYNAPAGPTVGIVLEPYPKEGGTGLRVSEEGVGSAWPVFSRDSRRITYQVGNGSPFGMIDVDTASLRVSNRRELGLVAPFNARRTDSMPGDDALIVTVTIAANAGVSTDAVTPRMIIVENWLEEVNERVPLD